MYQQKYIFTINDQFAEQSAIHVKASDLYSPERGYGFITEENMAQQPDLMLPELNGSFMPVPWYSLLEPAPIRATAYGCQINKTDADRQIPLRFKCNVPSDGSYRVRFLLRSEEELSDIRIFTGRRCLAAYLEKLPAAEAYSGEAYTEVCGIIPRGQEQIYENRCIELSVTANRPCLSEVTIESIQCPVLYIAGDSTVTDQSAQYPYAPQESYAGWGQLLPYYIEGMLTVSNHSHSGLTTESFRQEGHAAIPMGRFQKGDYMFFQFGHNDQKLAHLTAKEGYSSNLRTYIEECRSAGVYPLLVTPVARNTWRGSDGAYNDLLEEYAAACLLLGEQMSVPVLDLHRLSMEFVIRMEKEGAKKYFYPFDYTHHNDFGAQQMAAFICQEIKRVCGNWQIDDSGTAEMNAYQKLAAAIRENPLLWKEPVSLSPLQPPVGFHVQEATEEFAEPDRPSDTLLRAEALDMVIRRAGFFITNVYNDYFTDIIGHEWYAGAVECGLQNGIVTKDMCQDRKFYPTDPITRLDFITFLMMAYKSRRTLPCETHTPYHGTVKETLLPLLSAACQLGILAPDGSDALDGQISRHTGAALCRKLKIM